MYLDGLSFEMGVVAEQNIHINRRKLDILVNKNGKATPTTSRAITSKKRVAGKRRIRGIRTELRLLDAGDFDIVLAKV